jgi:hypothetical protein
MGKKSKKNRGRKLSRQERLQNNAPIPINTVPPKKNWSVGKILGIVAVIATIIVAYEPIRQLLLSKHDKYKEETFVEGDLKPDPINPIEHPERNYELYPNKPILNKVKSDSVHYVRGVLISDFDDVNPYVYVNCGNYIFPCYKTDLMKGVRIFASVFDCQKTYFDLFVQDKILYVSTEFKDLQKEETIGFIKFNHWSLYRSNMFDYNESEKKFEVIDKQHNIVFSIEYNKEGGGVFTSTVNINGYFISPEAVLVISNIKNYTEQNNWCIQKIDSNWKQEALIKIGTISSIF